MAKLLFLSYSLLIAQSIKLFTKNMQTPNLDSMNLANWMSLLPDSTLIQDISLPSTHDSAANEDYTNVDSTAFFEAMKPVIYKQSGLTFNTY